MVYGDLTIGLMYIFIAIGFGVTGLLTILSIIHGVGIVGIIGIGLTTITDGIDHTDLGTIGIKVLGIILDIM